MSNNKSHDSISFINLLMSNINNLTDDIYESLVDKDYVVLNSSIRKLQTLLKETQKLSEDEL
jgi:hypothetical protein